LSNYQIIASTILLFITIAVIVFFIKRARRKNSVSAQVTAILAPYVIDEVKEIIIPDGIGGLLEIEHLILVKQGLFLIESYPIQGNLFGAETIHDWTQIFEGRSYKFANPLRHIRTSRQAIKSLAPSIPVFCRVIFTADSHFPKGKPDEVSVLASLAEDMLALNDEKDISEHALKAWNSIMRIARKDGQAVIRRGGLDG